MNELYPKELISQVAESIDCGLICFINAETFEMEDVPRRFVENPGEYEALTGESGEMEDMKYPGWERVITIEPLDSNESFRIMEDFAESVPDQRLQQQLFGALSHPKPFANFKQIVDHSAFRQGWFDFRQNYLENYVKELIDFELDDNNELDFEEINGFYDDDGNKIDPESVPMHSLCVICRKHHIEDWEENLFCLMNRYDQRNEPDFRCDAFEKI